MNSSPDLNNISNNNHSDYTHIDCDDNLVLGTDFIMVQALRIEIEIHKKNIDKIAKSNS